LRAECALKLLLFYSQAQLLVTVKGIGLTIMMKPITLMVVAGGNL